MLAILVACTNHYAAILHVLSKGHYAYYEKFKRRLIGKVLEYRFINNSNDRIDWPNKTGIVLVTGL